MAINKSDYPNKVKTNLWANKTFSTFYYDFKIDGRRYRGLIDLSDKTNWNKRDKVSVAEAELIKIKNRKKDNIDDTITLDKYLERHYRLKKDTNWKKTRVSFYRTYIKPKCGSKKIIDIRKSHMEAVKKHIEDQGLKPRTVKQMLEVLNPVFQSAISDRLIQFNPLNGVKIKLDDTKKVVTDASEQLQKIKRAIYDEYKNNPFYLSFFLFIMQGRRRGEILKIRWENISFDHDYYLLTDTKPSEQQKFHLPEIIKIELLKFRETNGWVYKSKRTNGHMVDVRKQVAKIKKRLDIPFGLHYCRNVIVSAMAEQGYDAIHMSGALGHKNAHTIDKYLSLNYKKGSKIAGDVMQK